MESQPLKKTTVVEHNCITSESNEDKEEEKTRECDKWEWKEWKRLAKEEGLVMQVNELIEEKLSKGELVPNDPQYEENKEFIDELAAQAKNIQKIYQELTSHQGWTTQVDNHKGISVYYRKEENTEIHTFKTKDISIPAASIETKYLKEITDVNKVCYCKINLCWPLTNRDCVAQVFAFDCLDCSGAIILTGASIYSGSCADQIDLEVPQISQNTARLGLKKKIDIYF
ncbi:hypothetical protein RFI_06291 [Reticulomyxa filosa]|uniref:Uncharacterized protein n=1 Tax=Reticulomyxa filosa TaxID=46433 RepID=X6NYC0_RETFI|nr:hypothetical protein RFI_06291 [Reticulomyxa filosa]|eukprot:ETO30829.1 hypothetical protein RFI_06291 [Reticulomyxa filosa]